MGDARNDNTLFFEHNPANPNSNKALRTVTVFFHCYAIMCHAVTRIFLTTDNSHSRGQLPKIIDTYLT